MNIIAIGGGKKEHHLEPIISTLDTNNAVIIPSACSTPASYDKKVPACYTSLVELGLNTTILHEYREVPPPDKIAESLGRASLVYVIGGNTPYMLEKLQSDGTLESLHKQAVREDFWLTGTSAGALLPFESAMSCPAKKPAEEEWDYTFVSGMGLLRASATAHANQIDKHPSRELSTRFDHFIQITPETIGFGIENNAALILDNSVLRVGRATTEAAVHVVCNGEVIRDIRDEDQLNELYHDA